MKGNNSLLLNEATMIEAVQEYLDRRAIVPKDRVLGVRYDGNSFVVRVSEIEVPAQP